MNSGRNAHLNTNMCGPCVCVSERLRALTRIFFNPPARAKVAEDAKVADSDFAFAHADVWGLTFNIRREYCWSKWPTSEQCFPRSLMASQLSQAKALTQQNTGINQDNCGKHEKHKNVLERLEYCTNWCRRTQVPNCEYLIWSRERCSCSQRRDQQRIEEYDWVPFPIACEGRRPVLVLLQWLTNNVSY